MEKHIIINNFKIQNIIFFPKLVITIIRAECVKTIRAKHKILFFYKSIIIL